MSKHLLSIHNIVKTFPVKASAFSNKTLDLKAVDQVSLDLYQGETVGLVGESGCGKTTFGRTLLKIYDADRGRVFIDPSNAPVQEVLEMDGKRDALFPLMEDASGKSLRELKKQAALLKKEADALAARHDLLVMPPALLKQQRKRIQMVFQDPWASLNPRMLVRDIVGEGPREFGTHKGQALESWILSLLDRVGLPPTAANRYPHEFSGGQRQRIGIARALAVQPDLIVCDEPVSALDVSIQAQVLNLLAELQDEFDLTYLFIAHDLSVVQYVCDKVAVMYLGRMVEMAKSEKLYRNPRHPYTQSLLSAVPVADPDHQMKQILLEGDVPSPVNPPSGCTFHPRCRYVMDVCRERCPAFQADSTGHFTACFKANPPVES